MRTLLALLLVVSFGTAHALEFDREVDAKIKTQFLEDLDFMKSVRLAKSSPFHTEIFGAKGAEEYETYFTSRVESVGMNGCGDPNAVACVIPFWDSSKIWLTENFVKFSHPQIARTMIVYHEARHTESSKGNWGHATCPSPFNDEKGQPYKSIWTGAILEGKPACDSTRLGAYGSTTILLKNIEKACANCNEKVMADAGLYSDDQLNRMINRTEKENMKKDAALLQ